MVFIERDGSVHESQPWGLRRVQDCIWGFFNFFYMFGLTMFDSFTNGNKYEAVDYRIRNNRSGGGGGGGGGSGGSGGGGSGGGSGGDNRGPPKPPKRRMGGINHSSGVSAGGCAGGSCGM